MRPGGGRRCIPTLVGEGIKRILDTLLRSFRVGYAMAAQSGSICDRLRGRLIIGSDTGTTAGPR